MVFHHAPILCMGSGNNNNTIFRLGEFHTVLKFDISVFVPVLQAFHVRKQDSSFIKGDYYAKLAFFGCAVWD